MKVWVVVDSYDSVSRVFASEAAARKLASKWIREYREADFQVTVEHSGRCWLVFVDGGRTDYVTLDQREVE